MAEKKLSPAQARALIKSALNDGYRPSQVKNIEKVKAVLSTEQIQKTIDSTLKGSTTAKAATLNPKPATGKTVIGGLAGRGGGVGGMLGKGQIR